MLNEMKVLIVMPTINLYEIVIKLPGDGKRKKAVVQQTHFHAPMKRRL